ncbi:alginate lyase family protein [Lacticaseibacillus absianus]|uniref:alginate lyase family protein n=1 Tax=Lacticaseibacillus absianus TaxID=2729623 RepID=UPI0015C94A30|nr:alginate lyase family protein [Lacticaseibacillus absianus]
MSDLNELKRRLATHARYLAYDQLPALITPAAKAQLLAEADQLVDHVFAFDKPWDMERCPTPYRLDPLDYEAVFNDDPEWCFMLNRMDWLSTLMLAGQLSGQQHYYQAGLAAMQTWVAQHQTLQPRNSTRTLDTGIRLINWVDALTVLVAADAIDDQSLQTITASALAQAAYLQTHYIPKYKTSNWGSIQTCGLLVTLPLLQADYADTALFRWAQTELCEQVDLQVLDDGMQWEQSLMYHVEVLNNLMRVLARQRECGFALDPRIAPAAHRMATALQLTLTPSGELEPFGDTDRIAAGDVFTRASLLFDDATLRYSGMPAPDAETLYAFGSGVAAAYAALTPRRPETCVFDGTDSGNFAVRSDWQATANFMFFNNGPLGSGHGHADNLHVSVYGDGEALLVDSGRYTYREDHPLRPLLKGMAAHNGVIVDDHTYCAPVGSWEYASYGDPLKTYAAHKAGTHYLEGTMIGEQPLEVWTRKVVMLDQGIWVIEDTVRADGPHTLTQRFHLAPTLTVAEETTRGGLLLTGTRQWQLLNPASCVLRTEPLSARYNALTQHEVATFTQDFTDRVVATTILAPAAMQVTAVPILQDLSKPIPAQLGSAWQFTAGDGVVETVALFHMELFKGKKVYAVDGVPVHAQAVVVHRTPNGTAVRRLKL